MTLNDNSAGTYAEELLLFSSGFNFTAMWGMIMTDGKNLLGFLPLQMESGMSNYYRGCSNCWSSELANTTP